jgi:hypothetical protein
MDDVTLPTEVDITTLEQAITWLEQLQNAVETNCVGYLPEIRRQLSTANLDMSSADTELSGSATFFGGFHSARGIQANHDSSYDLARENLRTVAENLGKTASATRKIIENYRTVEDRNAANAKGIEDLLSQGTYTPKDPEALDQRVTEDVPDSGQARWVDPPTAPPTGPSDPTIFVA